MASLRDGLALGLLAFGVLLLLCIQLAVTPSGVAWDSVAGRYVRVWEPARRPVLVVLADVLDMALCDACEVLGW